MSNLESKNPIYQQTSLPILHTCDVVVAGGSLAGIASALELARAGRTVALVEARTYLGTEVTTTLRPWIPVMPDRDLTEYPELIAACIRATDVVPRAGEYPLRLDAVKICLEDLLLEAGVKIFYASQPVGLCSTENQVQGIVIGNKSGRQVIACSLVIDTTRTALVTRMSGATFQPELGKTAEYAITLEFDDVAFQECEDLIENVAEWTIPEKIQGVILKAITHRGYHGGSHGYLHGHVLIECTLDLPRRADSALDLTDRYVDARRKALEFASHLLWNEPTFRLAYLGAISQELTGPFAGPMAGPIPDWARPVDTFPGASFATPMTGVWCLNEAARAGENFGALIRNPVEACSIGAALGQRLNQHWEAASARKVQHRLEQNQKEQVAGNRLQVKEPESPQRGRNYKRVPNPQEEVPVLADVDVLVIGGGTSGAIATIAAAGEGVGTLVVEMNPGLGGTATFGGVHEYWAGWQAGFVEKSKEWVNKVHDQLRYPRTFGLVGGWNIEAKAQALAQEAQNAGAEILFDAIVTGAVVEGNVVRGVVVATPLGPAAVLGKMVIDATGDGDVAAFAGAEFTYGSARDHAVMWFSMPQFRSPAHTQNNFSSMVDISNILDYNRAILSGRRRGGQLHDHGTYIATRESRHILGDVVQTLTDQLRQRCWPDVINIAVSNNDIKGQISSDWMRVGLIPPNLEIENSFRMLLPRGLENILVVGKAVSVARDALPSIRMQPDFENLGGAAGLAAVQAIRSGKGLREVDIRTLQERLAQIGALPERILTRRLLPVEYTDADLEVLVAAFLADDRPFHRYSLMDLNEVFHERIPLVEICTAGERVIPLLERVLKQADGPGRLRAAQALALVGSSAGTEVLVAALKSQLSGKRLPQRDAFIQHVDKFAPDQAAMPDAAYLLYALGMTRDRRALPVWERVVDLLALASEEHVWSQREGVFAYVDAVCLGTEQLGDPAAAPLLKKLHTYPPFCNKQLTGGIQADYLKERPAYLEVVIGRALARCGSPDGVIILINYLNDVRALLAEQAHDELIAVSGRDFGKDAATWTQWLEAEGDHLKPAPWTAPTDPLLAWGGTVLRES
jgi:ribulose 1,5-bisphosphate synthetase/thiazole synthase